ncbi:hypothetical protein ACIRPO_16585 [Streptomyces bacillaris]|uniref:hypothetical protein n=1 Tax=Streptomyces bacillaris TaxID=68179 RepID=UPI00382CF917
MKTPNYPLALAISEAGWSNHETARRVNSRAAKNGHTGIAVSSARVSRWIRHGEKPRNPVPEILAELLAEQLGRPCTPQSLNIAPPCRVIVLFDQDEYQALAEQAAAQNLVLERYVQKALRATLEAVRRSQHDRARGEVHE